MPVRGFNIVPKTINNTENTLNKDVFVNVDELIYVYRDGNNDYVFIQDSGNGLPYEYVVDASAFNNLNDLLSSINSSVADNPLAIYNVLKKDNLNVNSDGSPKPVIINTSKFASFNQSPSSGAFVVSEGNGAQSLIEI